MGNTVAVSLASIEKNIKDHINTCLEQEYLTLHQVMTFEQQALQKVIASQEQFRAEAKQQQQGLQQVIAGQKHIVEMIRGLTASNAQERTPCSPQRNQSQSVDFGDASPSRSPEFTKNQKNTDSNGASKEGMDQTSSQASLETPLLYGQTHDSAETHVMPKNLQEVSRRGASTRITALFPKVDDLQVSVLESLRKQLYDVEDLYNESGCCQAIARSDYLKGFVTVVIAMNTIWIAIETDFNKEDLLCNAPMMFQIADNLFCTVFFFEITVRFMAFKRKLDAFSDAWFLFDSLTTMLMVWETWIMVFVYLTFGSLVSGKGGAQDSQALRMLRLVRLVRVARTTRLLHAFPELFILARGMIEGMRSVLAVLCLLMLFVYIFAVMFTMTLSGADVVGGVFDTVPRSMNILLLQVLCGPDVDFIQSLLAVHWLYYVMYLSFLLIATLTLMNMLIGILCDVVSNVADDSKEEILLKEVRSQVNRLANELDEDGDGGISKEEFDKITADANMTAMFTDLGVDVVAVAHFGKFIYEQCDELSYGDFGKLVCQFRGKKAATVQDVMDMRRYVTMELLSLESGIRDAVSDLNSLKLRAASE